MSKEVIRSIPGIGTARGRIHSRLLLNAIADPAEVSLRLPDGVRPHVTDGGGTVVGCCLLEIDDLRPRGLPSFVGVRIRAVAHRISAEWDTPDGETDVGVFVPMRHSDSRLASLVGGRWFPGVHQHVPIEVTRTPAHLDWRVGVSPFDNGFGLRVRVDVQTPTIDPTPVVCSTCVDPTLGLSPDHRGRLEAAHMAPDGREVRAVRVEELESTFFDSFETAKPAAAYLMEDLGVRWSAAAPRIASAAAVPA